MFSNQSVRDPERKLRRFAAAPGSQNDTNFDNLRRWIVARQSGETGKGLCWRVLLAEDDPANRAVLRNLLEQSGITVTEAVNGREAVRLIEETDIDLVLLDINMPEMDGLSAARAIRRMGAGKAGLPLIAVTSDVNDAALSDMQAAGFNGCLEKPVRRDDLFASILQVLSGRLAAE